MPNQIAIIHGWSDSSASFADLTGFLGRQGFDVTQIWLGDYVSLDDDVRIEDVAKRMEAVLRAAIAKGDLTPPFDLIVHSTGGLVAREWLATYYPTGQGCPVKRLLMLAPANFGSRLAALGKSMIGRVAKGWNNWFQTGEEMLRALELGSPYQWRLAERDLFDLDGEGLTGPYGPGKVLPFVITGTRAYSSGLRTIVNENGSDGTVRVCAANLNAVGMTIDFAADPKTPKVKMWARRTDVEFPCAVLPDRDHGAVAHPSQPSEADKATSDLAGRLIVQALRCASDQEYLAIHTEWQALSEMTAGLASDKARREAMFAKNRPDPQIYHQHMQASVRVIDDHGLPVPDYFLEFFSPGAAGTKDSEFFHKEVLSHVHVNSTDASYRCLFMDRTDLATRYYDRIRNPALRKLAVSVSAAKIGPNVRYFDSTKEGASGHHIVHEAYSDQAAKPHDRLYRNRTHFIEVIIPRQPVAKVFRLSR